MTTLPGLAAAPLRTEWHDRTRSRVVPVLIRLPAASAPAPTVLLSHGLGGSREGLAYLGEALAAAGYVAVHMQHKGSDSGIWQGSADPRSAMLSAATDIGAALARLQDIGFVLDHLASEPSLHGRVDPAAIAIAGHSYGAWTVSHMLGERLPLPAWGVTLPDPRLRAGVALSPIPPLGLPAAYAYGPITRPILHVTGTEDRGYGVSDWHDRTIGFRTATAPALLAVLNGAHHSSFAGEAELGGHWNEPTFQPRTATLARLFLDAVLRGDAAARTAAAHGTGLAAGDVVENKGFA